MSGQVRQAREAITEVRGTLRDTRKSRHCSVPVGFIAQHVRCPRVSMLRRYTPDPADVVDWREIEVDTDGTFEEGPVCIMDSRDQVLPRKTFRLVRVLWHHRGVEESTWEREDTMRATYPFLFRDEGTWVSRLIFK